MTRAHRRRTYFVAAGLIAAMAVPAPASSARPGPLPTVIGKVLVGHSVDGRRIVTWHLGNPSSRTTAVVLGQMHGDEKAGIAVTRSMILGRPVAGINLWVIQTMNPDGNSADTRQNAHGVDLNRNWPHNWRHLSGRYYSGRHPLSEPETRAMRRFLLRVHPQLM